MRKVERWVPPEVFTLIISSSVNRRRAPRSSANHLILCGVVTQITYATTPIAVVFEVKIKRVTICIRQTLLSTIFHVQLTGSQNTPFTSPPSAVMIPMIFPETRIYLLHIG